MDNYQGQREEPHLRIPFRLLDNREFIKWMGTAEGKIWHVMFRHTIRAPMKTGLGKKIYENYYKKGIIAMSYRLDSIAEMAGLNSKGHIHDCIQSMVDKGFILKHNDKWRGRNILVYELGVHDDGPNRHETIHAYRELIKLDGEKKIAGFRNTEPAGS